MNKTLLEKARCMFLNTGLSKEFWGEAINSACYIVNRSPSIPIDCRVLEEVWSSSPSNYANLRFFLLSYLCSRE